MNTSLEIKAAGAALIAGLVSLGGALLLAQPVHWLSDSSSGATAIVTQAPSISDSETVQSPALIAQGRQYFTMSCVECHGDDAHGDEGPDLHNLAISNARIAATIRKGVKGEMPTFTKKYNDVEIGALVAYLRSLK
jgi:mono/diheme cytochrome c family protein